GNDPSSGPDGVFDPNQSHSGQNGYSTGSYVLNLSVTADNQPPQVTAVSIDGGTSLGGATLDRSPHYLTVQFSEAVNLEQLAFTAFQQTSATTISAVFLEKGDGSHLFPRLESYDPAAHQARFLMLDGLSDG